MEILLQIAELKFSYLEEYLGKEKRLYMCFVDLDKAFDRVMVNLRCFL